MSKNAPHRSTRERPPAHPAADPPRARGLAEAAQAGWLSGGKNLSPKRHRPKAPRPWRSRNRKNFPPGPGEFPEKGEHLQVDAEPSKPQSQGVQRGPRPRLGGVPRTPGDLQQEGETHRRPLLGQEPGSLYGLCGPGEKAAAPEQGRKPGKEQDAPAHLHHRGRGVSHRGGQGSGPGRREGRPLPGRQGLAQAGEGPQQQPSQGDRSEEEPSLLRASQEAAAQKGNHKGRARVYAEQEHPLPLGGGDLPLLQQQGDAPGPGGIAP